MNCGASIVGKKRVLTVRAVTLIVNRFVRMSGIFSVRPCGRRPATGDKLTSAIENLSDVFYVARYSVIDGIPFAV